MKEKELKEQTKKDIKLLLSKTNEKEEEIKIYITPTIKKCIDLIATEQEQTPSKLIRKLLIKVIASNIDTLPELLDIILKGVDQADKRKENKKNNLLKSFNLDEEIIKEDLKPIEPENNLIEPITEEKKPLTPKLSEEENILNRVILIIKEHGDRADNSNLNRILKGNKAIVKDIKTSRDDILKLTDKMEETPTKNGIKNLIGYLDPKDKYKRKRI